MADILDQAQLHTENELQEAIIAARSTPVTPGVKPEGYCHYCFEDIEEPQLFCNADCATNHERRKNR